MCGEGGWRPSRDPGRLAGGSWFWPQGACCRKASEEPPPPAGLLASLASPEERAGGSPGGFGLLEAEVVFACRASGPVAPPSLSSGSYHWAQVSCPARRDLPGNGKGVLQRPRNRGGGSVKTRSREAVGAARILAGSAPRPSEAFGLGLEGRRAGPADPERALAAWSPCGGDVSDSGAGVLRPWKSRAKD